MPIAVECPRGHKRAYTENDRGNRVNCVYPHCLEQVDVPPRIVCPAMSSDPASLKVSSLRQSVHNGLHIGKR